MTVPIKTLTPTPLLRREGSRLLQTAKLELHCSQALPEVSACIIASSRDRSTTALTAAEGKTVVDIDVPEVRQPCELVCELRQGETVLDRKTIPWQPPRRWTVHVVQLSHHDVGYTDLASHVIQEHDRSLDAIIEMAAATRDFPEDARFSAVIEQAWSIDHFLNHAPPERHAAMIDLLRRGDLEVTALFGNLTTELCGHELLARSVYHAFRLKRKHGIPIVSAENNDIPGFTWGLCQVLTEAGIRMFCPGLPKYYNWGKTEDVPSFWDETAIFGKTNMPGAFWWEAPNGKRILFWSNNSGCGGSCDPSLPGLPERLQTLEQNDYPYSVLRWPVIGAGRDNSPYIEDYAHTIRAWNERWVSPRLVSSTNARFYEGILPQLPKTLPVFRGDVPGQDYPVGAASTAEATAVNRRNHSNLQSAEILASAASELTDYTYQADRLFNACEETLWHDEHTWGHHFPAGPTACASELEKAVHAHRAAALAHDVSNKAMARIADAIHLDTSDIHLVVFNPLPHQRSGPVTAPLRELDNCGSTMMRTEKGTLRGALLHDRWHVNPPLEIVEGNFDLVDVDTGEEVPYQLQDIDSPLGPQLYAAQRLGLGSGGKRYGGLFENPRGVKRDILFHAEHVPALGYRIYRLRPGNDQPEFPVQVSADKHTLENDFYRLELTPDTGFVRSLVDMESGREVIANNASHPFGAIVVRTPRGADETCMFKGIESVAAGPLAATLRAVFAACGHPRIEVTYTLHAREKRVDVAIGMVKDPTPLLETYAVFPFALPHGQFRHEAPLCVVDPARDRLPGAFADRLTVQNWVSVSDTECAVLWSSLDAPVVSLAQLWPGRISPAHSAIVRPDLVHPPQTPDDLRGGIIYSLLTANNFGTNLAVSQSGAFLFRYSFTSVQGELTDSDAARYGRQLTAPFSTIYTKHPGARPLPPVNSFMTIDQPAVQLVALKQAEDGNGLIVRVWNTSSESVSTKLEFPHLNIAEARLCTLAEEDTGESITAAPREVTLAIPKAAVITLRLVEHNQQLPR